MLSRDDLERELRRLRVQSHPAEFGAAVRDLAAVHSRGKEAMRDILESLLAQDPKHFAGAIRDLKAERKIPTLKTGPAPADGPAWLLAMLRHSGVRQADFLEAYATARNVGENGDCLSRLEKALSGAKRTYESDPAFRAEVDCFVELLADISGRFKKNLP